MQSREGMRGHVKTVVLPSKKNILGGCQNVSPSDKYRQSKMLFIRVACGYGLRRCFPAYHLAQGCPTRGPRKGFEWPARAFWNDQSYQLNCYVVYGKLAFREIDINFVNNCFLSNWFYSTTMQIVLLHISHIVTSAFFPHNCARASRISSQY